MERAFIITEKSKYYKDLKKYEANYLSQVNSIFKFLNENGVESEKYLLRGDGFVNVAFEESDIEDIVLGIIPTEEDNINFNKMLTKTDKYGLRYFKKRSEIGKKVAKYCVDEEVVINLSEPHTFDYLESLGYSRYKRALISLDERNYALKVESDTLREDDIPYGFIPIKISEFYKYKEEKTKK